MIQEPLECSHLLYKGVQFHDIEAPNLMFSSATQSELIVEYNFVKSEKIIIDDDDFTKFIKNDSKICISLKSKISLIILTRNYF